ncbi:MAG: DUF2188 domain-containing protein [Actinomycetota bacterium]
MTRGREPRRLQYRPVYTVAPDPSRGWRVRAERGRRGRRGFPDRAAAVAFAEQRAAGHLVAQLRVLGADGSLERDESIFNEPGCAEARAFLEACLAPYRDLGHTLDTLDAAEGRWYAENRDVKIAGATVRLFIGIHEGQMWDKIHVHGSLWDEWEGPRIAEDAFTLWPHEGGETPGRARPSP